jgi:FRG domain-containing protein
MEIIKVNKWSDFDSKVTKKHYRKWIFRGQSDSEWHLESSIHRAFIDAQSIHKLAKNKEKKLNRMDHENVMIDRFKSHAHLYLSHLPKEDDILSWLSLMQHYGAPTRLLDFTFSPYNALFFALESGNGDAAVYCINHHAIKDDDDREFGRKRTEVYSRILCKHSDNHCLFSFEPTFSNRRLLSQQGLFVAPNTLDVTHEQIINDYNISDTNFIKFIISKKLRLSGLRKLNQMNINAANIYLGLDGFCKSMLKQPVFGLEWQKRVN